MCLGAIAPVGLTDEVHLLLLLALVESRQGLSGGGRLRLWLFGFPRVSAMLDSPRESLVSRVR